MFDARLAPFVLLMVGALGFAAAARAATEAALDQAYAEKIDPLMASAEAGTFAGVQAVPIAYRIFKQPKPKGSVVFMAGYSESYVKYGETILDLYEHGYDVYTMDHRGMGYSGRMTKNPQIVHVERFSDYVDDLERFVESYVKPHAQGPLYYLANSTGALVGSMLAARQPGLFKALAFTSPLFQVNTGRYSEGLTYFVVSFNCLRWAGDSYAPGFQDYDPKKDDPNAWRITKSPARIKKLLETYAQHPVTVMGGASNNWVKQAITATKDREHLATQLKDPVLMLQASDDFYVVPEASVEVCGKARDCRRLVLPDTYHELLIEKDAARSQAISEILAHFDAHGLAN